MMCSLNKAQLPVIKNLTRVRGMDAANSTRLSRALAGLHLLGVKRLQVATADIAEIEAEDTQEVEQAAE
jgi:hypothetical protein